MFLTVLLEQIYKSQKYKIDMTKNGRSPYFVFKKMYYLSFLTIDFSEFHKDQGFPKKAIFSFFYIICIF